jgi:hypothetical protein
MYIIKPESTTDSLLSYEQVQVNNLKIKINGLGTIKIETGGEWTGDIPELISMLEDLTSKVIEVKDAN